MADNRKEQERAELHRAIWAIADDLRGAVDGWDFKNYVPVSYEKVQTLHKTYEYNIQAGFTNAADKEAFKLNFAINSELLPELVETQNELTKRTAEDIIKAHPEMANVIYKLDEIEKEVEVWKQQIEKK